MQYDPFRGRMSLLKEVTHIRLLVVCHHGLILLAMVQIYLNTVSDLQHHLHVYSMLTRMYSR